MAYRPALSPEECRAVQAELETLYRKYGSDHAVAEWLGCSQQTMHRARTRGRVGPVVATALYELLGVTREILIARYRDRASEGPVETPSTLETEELELPPDKFPARATAARRALIAKYWQVTPSAIRYVCTAPEWQSPRFSTRSAVFWVEQMKLHSLEEMHARPASEEERAFQAALRKLNAQRKKEKRRAEEATAPTASEDAATPSSADAIPIKTAG
jgi:hypothetical protein